MTHQKLYFATLAIASKNRDCFIERGFTASKILVEPFTNDPRILVGVDSPVVYSFEVWHPVTDKGLSWRVPNAKPPTAKKRTKSRSASQTPSLPNAPADS